MRKKIFLTIAGSDCIGGAGIQADIKTAERLGQYACCVVTAITAQNSAGVAGIYHVSKEILEAQLSAVFEDIRPDSVKIGMLPGMENICTVAAYLEKYKPNHIVLDPVISSTLNPESIHGEESLKVMVEQLFPLAEVVTPNVEELKILDETIGDISEYCNALLMKGGHNAGKTSTDTLFMADMESFSFSHDRIATTNTHGSGCVLSSAIACYLGDGMTLPEAVSEAKGFLHRALLEGKHRSFGKGEYGPSLF